MGAALTAGWAIALWAIVLGCLGASIGVYHWRLSPPLGITLVVALSLRLIVIVISRGHTPGDVGELFQSVGRLVIDGRDPLRFMPRYTWNFLPPMAYVFAAEIKTGIGWQTASKIVPLFADLATTVMVGAFVEARRAAMTRTLYAVSPLAILVAAHHGQVEPVSIALGLAALLLAGRGRPGLAGVALGFAVATKTWPVLFIPGVLRELPVRTWWRALLAAAGVIAVFLASNRVLLHGSLHNAVHVLTSYRSFFGSYGWSGLLHLWGNAGLGYAGPDVDPYQRVGTLVMVATLIGLLVLFHRASGPDLTVVLILGFITVTAGFGGQYLLWPAALIYARRLPRGWPYVVTACFYGAFFYLVTLQVSPQTNIDTNVPIQTWTSFAVIATALWAIPWRDAANPFSRWHRRATPGDADNRERPTVRPDDVPTDSPSPRSSN
jgi:hypothetical protein